MVLLPLSRYWQFAKEFNNTYGLWSWTARFICFKHCMVVTFAGDRVHDDVNNHVDSMFSPVHHCSPWGSSR